MEMMLLFFRNSHRCFGPTTRLTEYSVPTLNRRRAPDNRTPSDGVHGSGGRGERSRSMEMNRQHQRRFRWTEELKEDLVRCWEDSEPARYGFMERLHTLWGELHPELSHFSKNHLRSQAAYLVRKGYQLLIVRPELSFRQSIRLSLGGGQQQQQQPPQREVVSPPRSVDERDMKERERITGKYPLRAEHLAEANVALGEELPEDVSLLDVNWAVYETALLLKPQTSDENHSFAVKTKRRMEQLQNKINEARRQASRVQCVIEYVSSGRPFTARVRKISADLRYRHHTLNNGILIIIKERYIERIRVLRTIKKSLEKRLKKKVENSTFLSDPNRWFTPKEPVPDESPTVEQVEEFWKDFYGEVPHLRHKTPALRAFEEFCKEHQMQREQFSPVTEQEIKQALRGMKNHAAPGPDGINTFWWKKLTSVHSHLARIFTSFIEGSVPVPAWLVEGRTVLLPKKGDLSDPKNYRPITCLNALYKIFTKVYYERLIKEIDVIWRQVYEQRGAKRGLSGCKENLLVDRCVVQDAIQYKRNLSVAWIDYRKAFDSTSHELIIHLLRCLRVSDELVRCLQDLMPLWRTRFTVTSRERQRTTGVVQYRRGIFQGDSLSPLLFCISLMPLSVALRAVPGYDAGRPGHRIHKITHVYYMDDLKLFASGERALRLLTNIVATYSRAVGMSFGLDKCAVFHLHRGRVEDASRDIQLVDGSVIHHLGAEETYRYLGFEQRSIQNAEAVKESLRSEYKQRLRRVWRSELSGKNKVAATNMFAVPVLLYSFGVIKWRRDELRELDRDTRKIMHMHRSLHPRSSSVRLYFPREMGGRGLLGLECLHDRLVLGLACDIINGSDPLLDFVHDHETRGVGAFLYKAADHAADSLGLEFRYGLGGNLPVNSLLGMAKPQRKERIRVAEQQNLLQCHMDKPMHGVFFRHMMEQGLSLQLTFAFLQSAGLMSETEGFICACQDGVINTLVYQCNVIGRPLPNVICRACGQSPETLMHLLSACPVYAVSGYIHRHNAALRVLYYFLRHFYGIDRAPVLPYLPGDIESVVVNERCKIYWNFSFATIRRIEATKPDVVLFDFDDKIIYVIEFSAPCEANVSRKEEEKRVKYQPLLFELRQLNRGFKVKLVVLIIGTLGGMKDSFISALGRIPACKQAVRFLAGQMQKAVILGSLRILRQHDTGLR